MKHFTSKAYLVTYERRISWGREYGVEAIYNKKSDAKIKLTELNKNSLDDTRVEYKIVEVDLDKGGKLFEFNY